MRRVWTCLQHASGKYDRLLPPVLRSRQLATAADKALSAVSTVERDNESLLSVVARKVAERDDLMKRIHSGANMGKQNRSGLSRQLKNLNTVYEAWVGWQKTRATLVDTIPLLEDEDISIRTLAEEELSGLIGSLSIQTDSLTKSLLPQSATAELSALIELKPGVGGSEASLFLEDLLRMYTRFSVTKGWQAKLASKDDRDEGGLKFATLEVTGHGAYDEFRWESGVHRVQRVPATEASGRVHTSTVSVVVLPLTSETEATDEREKLYEDKDIRIEVMRARGAGGQHVNKTESAVRLTHVPTGITVSMQDERSQHMNRQRAYRVLEARLLDRKLRAEVAERRDVRRQLVRSSDRSEKIRTYNFVQDRVTDHRINYTTLNLDDILDGGGLQLIIEALKSNHEKELIEDILEA